MPSQKLSIVQVIDTLNTGGAEKVLVTLANIQHEHGHNVKVITTVKSGPLSNQLHEEIALKNLGRKWKWNPFTMYKLITEVKDFDVVHVHSFYNLRYLYLASFLFRLRKRIFFHDHFGDIEINPGATWQQTFIYPKTILIAVSAYIANWAIEVIKMDANRVFILPNIVRKEKITSPLKFNKNYKHILIVSNFRTTKNIEFAVDLFERLIAGKKYNFYFTIVGKIADEKYYEQITKMIRDKKMDEFLRIIDDCDSIQYLLPPFDLAIHTAVSESGPLVLIEYIAQNLPFLSYETGEVVRQIKNDVPDFVIASFNIEEWLNRIYTLLQTEKSYWEEILPFIFEKHFSEKKYYQACIGIYASSLPRT